MSVTKRNTVKLEGVDWDFHLERSSNKVTAKGTYRDDYENWMARCPEPDSPHPDIPALKLNIITAKRIEGDLIDVTLQYECTDPEASYPGRAAGKVKRYTMEVTAGEEPLLTNALFKDFTDAEREAASELIASGKTSDDFSKAAAALTSEAAGKFLIKVRRGEESYLNPGMIWVERFTTKDLDDISLSKILKTTSNPPGDAPSPGDERNYLRLPPNITPHDDGKTWDIENRWQLSLKGKWDADIYPAGG